MADLEESFLKSNVPGRYSSWANDDDDDGGNHDGGGGESNNAAAAVAGPPTALNRLEAPAPSRNTGAKGVLADRQAAKEEEAYRREVEKRETAALLDRAVRGATMGPGEVSASLAAEEERRRADRIRTREAEERGDDSDGGDGSSDDDDAFMRSYRQKRLLELQNAASSASSSADLYSEVEEVTPIQYAEAVDETDAGTLLVVHLYEPHIPACADVNHHLDALARSSSSRNGGLGLGKVRFLRLRATEAKSDLDLVGLPSLLAYRGGRLVQNWTPVTQHLPPGFTAEDVQTLLVDCI